MVKSIFSDPIHFFSLYEYEEIYSESRGMEYEVFDLIKKDI